MEVSLYALIQLDGLQNPVVYLFGNGKSCRVEKDILSTKDGSTFPAAYVITPLLEDGELNGSIMVFRDITKQEKDQILIHQMAFYDELTHLPNFRLLKEELTDLIQKHPEQKAAILELDIDRFKMINEALGYSFGDSILKAVGERLEQGLSGKMILGRMTGDQFGLILPSIAEVDEIMRVI